MRTCTAVADDPVCLANKLACQGQLTACIGASLVAYNVTAPCLASVVSLYLSSGASWQATALLCGLSAETIHFASQQCQ